MSKVHIAFSFCFVVEAKLWDAIDCETKCTCLQYIEPQNLLSLLMNSRHQVMIRGVGTLVWMSSDVSIRLIPLKCKLFPVFRC